MPEVEHDRVPDAHCNRLIDAEKLLIWCFKAMVFSWPIIKFRPEIHQNLTTLPKRHNSPTSY